MIRRAAAGESVDITDRGRLVARLVPVTADPYEDLVARGQVRRATRSLGDIGEPIEGEPGPSLSAIVGEHREDER
jgi:antitoxin (DNA-binding transcriptional repressor) of toxin-antitoxin stability system